jgi:pyruvate kinase
MVENGIPTRAELNDIVASLLMGADGLVLAAETAMGKHPVRCVEIADAMRRLFAKWTMNSTIDDIFSM